MRVVFEDNNYHVTEGSDSLSVCVRREGEVADSFTVTVTTSNTNPIQAEGESSQII